MIETMYHIDRLREVALDQHGFVTTAEASDMGVSKATLSKLASRGRIERVAHGVYRIPQTPRSHLDRFMLAVLWTGAPEALISHESALDLYDVCDVNPKVIDIAVAKGRRISRSGGEGYRIHRIDVAEVDRTWREEVPVVALRLAVEQCLEAGTPTYLVEQAIENGREKGFITAAEAAALNSRTYSQSAQPMRDSSVASYANCP